MSTAAMRVLVVGASGMLGSAMTSIFAARGFAVLAAARRLPRDLPAGVSRFVVGDLSPPGAAEDLVSQAAPDAVVNCVGLVKQRPQGNEAIGAILVNALLPHRLAAACAARGARFVQIGTDCVFSGAPDGRRGPAGYRECDPTDPGDVYGRSKLLGEVTGPGCLTLRMSLVGREPAGSRQGLFEWFLAAPSPVRGFSRALFTGLTTPVAARLVADILAGHPDLDGLWHAAAPAISKLDLLRAVSVRARPDVEIVPTSEPAIDRRLDGAALAARIGWQAPDWPAMLDELFPPPAALVSDPPAPPA